MKWLKKLFPPPQEHPTEAGMRAQQELAMQQAQKVQEETPSIEHQLFWGDPFDLSSKNFSLMVNKEAKIRFRSDHCRAAFLSGAKWIRTQSKLSKPGETLK